MRPQNKRPLGKEHPRSATEAHHTPSDTRPNAQQPRAGAHSRKRAEWRRGTTANRRSDRARHRPALPKGRGQETSARRIRSAHKGIAAYKVTILFIHGCAAQRASPKRAAEGAEIQRPGLDDDAQDARRRRPGHTPQNDCSRPRRIACLCAERMETEHHNRPNRQAVGLLPTQNTTARRRALVGHAGGRNHRV